MFEKLLDSMQGDILPNKFTIYMGNQIRKARLELGLTQKELAENAHFRQAAISDIENGKRTVTTADLIFLGRELKKPAIYFFDDIAKRMLFLEEETPEASELLMLFRRLPDEDKKRVLLFVNALYDSIYK